MGQELACGSWRDSGGAAGELGQDDAASTASSQSLPEASDDGAEDAEGALLVDTSAAGLSSWIEVADSPLTQKEAAAQEDYRLGNLPRGSKLARALTPTADAATPAMTACERAMWAAQYQLDLSRGRSTQRLRGPPPFSRNDVEEDLVAPATRVRERQEGARTRGSLAAWFDLHEESKYIERQFEATLASFAE